MEAMSPIHKLKLDVKLSRKTISHKCWLFYDEPIDDEEDNYNEDDYEEDDLLPLTVDGEWSYGNLCFFPH